MGQFERDLVIANDDGKVYRITQDQLNKLQHVDLTSDTFQLIRGLLAQGVSSAAIPNAGSGAAGPEPDAFCYLVNLASLKHSTVFEGPAGRATRKKKPRAKAKAKAKPKAKAKAKGKKR
jgi:hypothetical protein